MARAGTDLERAFGTVIGIMCVPVYPSDLTDAEWVAIGPLLGEPAHDCACRPDLRYVINGILFLLRSGTEIRTAPPWSTAEAYYAQWQASGTWAKVMAALLTSRPERRPSDNPPRDE